MHAAIVDAVRTGRLAEERLAEAADRVAALCRWASPTSAGAAGRAVGAEAARRALQVVGDVAIAGPILVLELVPEANIAAGEALHGPADVLPDAVVDSASRSSPRSGRAPRRSTRVAASSSSPATRAGMRGRSGRWPRPSRLRPDLIVVETGLPSGRPDAGAFIATLGAGRANLEAMADAMR